MAASPRAEVISIQGLTKQFGSFRALDEFNLTVREGEVHGFLGPNGAGKSTTIRVLLGLMRKTSGEVALFGRDPWNDAVALHRRLVYVPGEVNFWPNLTGGEIIDVLGGLRGGLDDVRRSELIERFSFDPSKKFRAYSKGNRQKVALIAALASDVDLYVFDEPTSGLDPLMEQVFQDEIRALKEQGKTILLSSHILAEVETLCDQVTIIRAGKTVASAGLTELRAKHRSEITVQVDGEVASIAKITGVHDFVEVAGGAQFTIRSDATAAMLKELSRYKVTHMTSQPPTLESLFLSHYDNKGGK